MYRVTGNPLHYIVFNPSTHGFSSWQDRLPQTSLALQSYTSSRLAHPESPLHVAGTTPHRVLSALGARTEPIPPLVTLTPEALRFLRNHFHSHKHTKEPIVIVGMLDNDSPYGSRRMLEELVRLLNSLEVTYIIYPAVWHMTPQEYAQGLVEIATLASFGCGRMESVIRFDMQPSVSAPSSSVLFANHHLHSFRKDYGYDTQKQWAYLPYTHSQSEPWIDSLRKNQYSRVISHNPDYIESLLGSSYNEYPYLDSHILNSPIHTLEFLHDSTQDLGLSPYYQIVMLDEERSPEFDPLFARYIKSLDENPLACFVTQPTSLAGNRVYSSVSPQNLSYQSFLPSAFEISWIGA